MGKRYRENWKGEWEEVNEADEGGEGMALAFVVCIAFILGCSIGIVLWAPFQILLKTPGWVSIVMPCIITLGIYLKAPSLFWLLNACAWILMLIDIFIFDWYCFSRYFEPLLTSLQSF